MTTEIVKFNRLDEKVIPPEKTGFTAKFGTTGW